MLKPIIIRQIKQQAWAELGQAQPTFYSWVEGHAKPVK